MSSRSLIRPSENKKPAASSKSLPGVRIVMARLRVSPPALRRISSGSSVARSSTNSRRFPFSSAVTDAGVVKPGRSAIIAAYLPVVSRVFEDIVEYLRIDGVRFAEIQPCADRRAVGRLRIERIHVDARFD